MGYQEIISVGIDIGTSTTQTVFSKLKMQNTAGYFAVPKISIIDKTTLYKSPIHLTPLLDGTTIDSDKVKNLVESDFADAGFTQKDTATGAVIITGEAARKENAQAVLNRLSNFAGEFVVSTAGPDLESIIAGKGSGAYEYSLDNFTTAINLDIGGGTTNVVLFDKGEVLAKGCLDIGGRQIVVNDNKITYISDSAKKIAESLNLAISIDDTAEIGMLTKITDKMADLLYKFIMGIEDDLITQITTTGSTKYDGIKPAAVFFSGGVADEIYTPNEDDLAYQDIGVLLGKSIRNSGLYKEFNVQESGETIRATVVGAGSYTTTVSGSTISIDKDVLPIKNVPVLKLNDEEYLEATKGNYKPIKEKLSWFLQETDSNNCLIAFTGDPSTSYETLKQLSYSVARAVTGVIDETEPILVAVESDMAKVFGQTLNRELAKKHSVVSIDSVKLNGNDYVDLGTPLMDGLVIPIVVKTLIFG